MIAKLELTEVLYSRDRQNDCGSSIDVMIVQPSPNRNE